MPHNAAIRAVARAGEGKDRSFNKITANWVTTQFAVILLNDLLTLLLITSSGHARPYHIVACRDVATDAKDFFGVGLVRSVQASGMSLN